MSVKQDGRNYPLTASNCRYNGLSETSPTPKFPGHKATRLVSWEVSLDHAYHKLQLNIKPKSMTEFQEVLQVIWVSRLDRQ